MGTLDAIEKMSGGKKVEPKKRGLSTAGKVGIAAAVGITAFEGAGIGYDAAKYTGEQALPISTMAEHPFGIGLPPKVEIIPSTFDPSAINSVIGPENFIQMTLEEYEVTSLTAWNAETKTMTIPLPIVFNRIPTLRIERTINPITPSRNNMIVVDGLQQGDIILSPIEGEILIFQGDEDLNSFRISTKDSQGEPIVVWVTTTGLSPLVNLKHPIRENISIPIKKGDLIGSLLTSEKHIAFNGQIQITGNAPLLETLNLATTSEGKAIIIAK
jgi:hypothetical protein